MSINNINNNGSVKTTIDNQKLSQQQQAVSDSAQQAGSQKAATSPVRQDSVSLTSSAQQLTQVQKKGTEAPVNQDKVERLKKAIQSGEYQINAESVAKRITALESEIFGTNG